MSKLEQVIGNNHTNEYNEGFDAGLNFVKTVISSSEFADKLFRNIVKLNTNEKMNETIINTLKDFNV